MSSEIDNGGPAFPVADSVYPNGQIQYGFTGMTLRDWFAGQALAGLLANATLGSEPAGEIARWSYETADAMLAERAKRQEAQS